MIGRIIGSSTRWTTLAPACVTSTLCYRLISCRSHRTSGNKVRDQGISPSLASQCTSFHAVSVAVSLCPSVQRASGRVSGRCWRCLLKEPRRVLGLETRESVSPLLVPGISRCFAVCMRATMTEEGSQMRGGNQVFPSRLERRLLVWYRKFPSLDAVPNSVR